MSTLVSFLVTVVLALAFAYVAVRSLRRRAMCEEIATRLEEVADDLDAQAAGMSLVSSWLDDLGHDPNRAEIRTFAKAASTRPPAKVRHSGRVTRPGA